MSSTAASIRSASRLAEEPATPFTLSAYSTFSSAVRAENKWNCWNTKPIDRFRTSGSRFGRRGFHLLSVDDDPSRRGSQQAAEDKEQRGFPRSRRTLEHDHLAAFQLQGDSSEDGYRLLPLDETFGNTDSFKNGHIAFFLDQPRKTIAGSRPAILRNEINEAPRQSAIAPRKTSPIRIGGMISFKSNSAMSGRTA